MIYVVEVRSSRTSGVEATAPKMPPENSTIEQAFFTRLVSSELEASATRRHS
jgi:hypothetical protein